MTMATVNIVEDKSFYKVKGFFLVSPQILLLRDESCL